ncbi:hypothetical protein [Taibaiella soli]|uniref:hypothetical protein n=1 Tax=Taibaiella soli TaxID=1649169 RepID=UPI001403B216
MGIEYLKGHRWVLKKSSEGSGATLSDGSGKISEKKRACYRCGGRAFLANYHR